MQIYLYNSFFFCNFVPNYYCLYMIRLSIIVPFYNAEPYIEQCIRSLYNQDIPQEEYEVICVDDCSPDGSRVIVERLQNEYSTLRLLVHPKNKRQGGARNTGLKEAMGDYVWFVDSDDYLVPNCLGRLLRQVEEDNLDLLKFYFQFDNGKTIVSESMMESDVCTGSQMIFEVITDIPLLRRCSSSVKQIIRRDFITVNSIYFAEGVQYEDDEYAYQLYACAERVKSIAFAPYVVRLSANSTTRRKNDLRRVQDIYAQALRMVGLRDKLTKGDTRWNEMIEMGIRDSFNNQMFRMLKDCSFKEQLHFWCVDRKNIHCFKPYLSRKAYVKLCSYIMWKLLQD